MKRPFRSLAGVGLLALLVGFLTVGFAGVASAATPPWQTSPPAQELGGLLFFNSAGQQITGGSTTVAPFAAYVEGTTVLNSSNTLATLYGYTPVAGEPPGSWSGTAFGGATHYPNASAPASLNTAAPLYTGASTDLTLSQYAEAYPNGSSTSGYVGLYEIRLKTSSPTTTNYDAADISISGDTWSVVYPAVTPTPTTIALTATPSGSQTYGQAVALQAVVSPAVAGSVQFEDNGADIGSPVSETDGTASTSTSDLGVTLPVGANALDAVFTPAPDLAYSGSSTATESPVGTADYTVNQIGTSTTVSSTSPASPQLSGTSVTIQATVADDDASTPAGTVEYEYQLNGSGSEEEIQSVTVNPDGSVPSVSTASLPVGTDDLSAVFTPSSSDYSSSTATGVPYTIQTPPGDTTVTALTVDPTSAAEYSPVLLTASVTDSTTTATSLAPVGTVSFYDNGATNSNAITGSSVLLGKSNTSGGTATLTYPIGPTGSHYIVAVYSSSDLDDWADSTSDAVQFTATAATSYAPDGQDVNVSIPPGTLTITTPWTPSSPFQLGTASLNAGDGLYWASAHFGSASNPTQGVTITDTGIGESTWTASAEITNFTGGSGPADTINAQNVTFTQVTAEYITGNDYGSGTGEIPIATTEVDNAYGVTDTPPTGTGVYAGDASLVDGGDGLAGQPHAFATSTAPGDGSVNIIGNLNLAAPSSVTPGLYTATLTFTVA